MKTPDRKEAYRDKARAMLELWGAEITQMRAKAHMLQADARIEAMQHLDELERFYNDAFRHYAALQDSSGGQLDEVKRAFEKATERIRQKLEEMVEAVA